MDEKKLEEELTKYNKEMTKVLTDLDLVAARKFMTKDLTDEVILVALHKARVHAVSVDKALRLESMEWLRGHGFNDLYGTTLPPPGQLPM